MQIQKCTEIKADKLRLNICCGINFPHLLKGESTSILIFHIQYLRMAPWENIVSRKFPNISTSLQHNYFPVRCLHYCTITKWTWGVLTTYRVIYRKRKFTDANRNELHQYTLKYKGILLSYLSWFYLPNIMHYHNSNELEPNV